MYTIWKRKSASLLLSVLSQENIANTLGKRLDMYIPVQRGDQRIESEWCLIIFILIPDSACLRYVSIMWDAIGIVDADDDIQQPSQNRTDLVGPDSLGIVAIAKCERVGCENSY
jgi:hypothetical protein